MRKQGVIFCAGLGLAVLAFVSLAPVYNPPATGVTVEVDPVAKAVNGVLKSNGTTLSAATAGRDYSAPQTITSTAHGFSVGNVLRMSGTSYVKAQANSATNAEAVGIVSLVPDANTFILATGGYVSSLSGLTSGAMHFLDPTTAGAITATEPTTDGQISKPVFIAVSTTAGYFFNMRGAEVGGSDPGYLVYTALLTQGGTDAPVATVLHNTLGGTVVWTRPDDPGHYIGTLSGAFTLGKTTPLSQIINTYSGEPATFGDIRFLTGESGNVNEYSLHTYKDSALTDALLANNLIEIRVYP